MQTLPTHCLTLATDQADAFFPQSDNGTRSYKLKLAFFVGLTRANYSPSRERAEVAITRGACFVRQNGYLGARHRLAVVVNDAASNHHLLQSVFRRFRRGFRHIFARRLID